MKLVRIPYSRHESVRLHPRYDFRDKTGMWVRSSLRKDKRAISCADGYSKETLIKVLRGENP